MVKQVPINATQTILYCDICGKEVDCIKVCPICGIDVCDKCSVKHDFSSDLTLENEFGGDYPNWICRTCWSCGRDYREHVQEIRDAANVTEEKFINQWKNDMRARRHKPMGVIQ